MKNRLQYEKAYWLLRNSSLTFKQIADYCDIDPLEVAALENADNSPYRQGHNLILFGELTKEEILRCEADETLALVGKKPPIAAMRKKSGASKAASKKAVIKKASNNTEVNTEEK